MRRSFALLLCMVWALLCLFPAAAPAESTSNVIRVGWYDTPFNHKDALGRRTGYAYEYQQKIAAYTGWKYEYIEGNWPELLQMLEEGRIDLLSDVSYTEERSEYMLYSDIPMGTELYFLYVSPDNRDISIEDCTTLNGKKIGVTKESIQKDLFLEWAENHDVSAELIELSCSESESLNMLKKGNIDAFITLDTYADHDIAVPLWKVGSSDFFFAVSRKYPDLLSRLNAALNRIQDEDKHYSDHLSEKYLMDAGTNLYLTAEEQDWLNVHGPIRVGYQDNYLAFCAADPKTGDLTGALKDYLDYASGTLENAHPDFEAVCYSTAAAALEAVKTGEVDCMFPANLTAYDAEMAGVVMTAPLIRTKMEAVIREEDHRDFLRKTQVRVGVNRGNPNYEMFLAEHFPAWTPVYYEDTSACLDAVASKGADCVIISNYRFSDISGQCRRLNLTSVYTGVDMDYSLAVRVGNTELYSILSRLIRQVPDSAVNAALTYYSAGARSGFADWLLIHPAVIVFAVISLILLGVILVLLRRLQTLKKPAEKSSGA